MMFLWQVTRSPTQLRAAMASTLLEYFICRHFDEAARTLSLINGSCYQVLRCQSCWIIYHFDFFSPSSPSLWCIKARRRSAETSCTGWGRIIYQSICFGRCVLLQRSVCVCVYLRKNTSQTLVWDQSIVKQYFPYRINLRNPNSYHKNRL